MKKIVSLILVAVLVVFTFTACNNNNNPNNPNASTGSSLGGENPGSSSSGSNNPDDPVIPDEVVFEACDETVYTTEGLNLRTSTTFDTDDNIATYVNAGTQLRRIGYHETWSKVVYNDVEYFCSTKYVSTELPADQITFTDVEETLYVYPDGKWEGASKLYTAPDRSKEASITIAAKTAVTRTGVYYENSEDPEKLGWSRIEYNDATYYIRNSQLTETTPPAAPAESAN